MAAENARSGERRGLASAGAMVARIARPLFRRRGFAEGAIITDWTAIVGAHLASIAIPERLVFERGRRDQGMLVVRVASAFGPEVQHLSPQIIDKVNVHFGYPAVSRLKILPGVLPEPPRRPTPKGPAPEPPSEATLDSLRGITDPELRAALERLGRALKNAAHTRPARAAKVFGDK
jgi:hypothetical protein